MNIADIISVRRRWVMTPITAVLFTTLFMKPSLSVAAWQDWFQTPEQRAMQLWEDGSGTTLIDKAPSDSWKGLGHFQEGEFDAAASSFEQARQEAESIGDGQAVQRELFNAATSHVHNGRLDEAIRQFDELLEMNPDHENALHNKQIAEQLLEQQTQQQSGDSEQSGDDNQNSESGEQQDGQQGSEQQQGAQDGEQGDSSEQEQSGSTEGQSDDESSAGQSGEAADTGESAADQAAESGSDRDDNEENSEAAARAALDAEKNAGGEVKSAPDDEEAEGEASEGVAVQPAEEPLTEQQQATEQWLRQIPDDPAGLLRRKLIQSHRLEYPGVQSSEERW